MTGARLLSTWLCESAWFYLVACSLVAAASPGVALSPAAVLIPYGLAMAVTLALGVGARLGARHAVLGVLRAVLFTALYLLAGLLTLLLAAWWELHRTEPLLDPSWVHLAMRDAAPPFLTPPSLPWLAALAVLLWWRGTHLAREESDFAQVIPRFFWGTVTLLWLAAVGIDPPHPGLAPWLLGAYVLFGLMALSVARLEEAERDRQGSTDAGWWWRTSAIAVLLLAAGFGIALLLLPMLGELAGWLRDLWTDRLLPALQEILRWIAHLLGLDKPPQPLPATPEGFARPPAGRGEPPLSLPEAVRTVGRRLFDLT